MHLSKLKMLHGVIRRQFKICAAATAKGKSATSNVEKEVKKVESQVNKAERQIERDTKKTAREIERDIKKSEAKADRAAKALEKDVKTSAQKTDRELKKTSKDVENDLKKAEQKGQVEKSAKKGWASRFGSKKTAKADAQELDCEPQDDADVKAKAKEEKKEMIKEDKKGKSKDDKECKEDKKAASKETTDEEHTRAKDVDESDAHATGMVEKKVCSKFDGKLVGTCKIAKFSNELVCAERVVCPKVAILGAGMAGLTAAWRLNKVGMNNFTVYEAKQRIGGRIHSAWSGEGINEYGTEWIEGDFNPVLRLAYQEELTMCHECEDCSIYMTEDGRPVIQAYVDESTANWNRILEEGVKTYCNNSEDAFIDYSLLDFINKQKSKLEWKSDEAKVLFESMSYGGSCRLGGPSHQLSLNDLGAKFRYETRQGVKEGMVAVLAPILKGIPETKIKLNRRVQLIQWDQTPVKLVFEDCSEETADIVIVTFSLGVLKKDTELFEPELPPDKLEAIEKTGYCTVNKIFLDYADPFWLKGEGRVFLSRNIDHEASCWEDAIFKIREICGGNNTLEISLCGRPAVDLEEQCEEDVAKKVTQLIRKYTGVAITPFPIAVAKTCWSSDPSFMGSISFMGRNANKRHLRALGLPIPLLSAVPRVLFAGDHTACGEIGSVKGARISGF